MKTTILLRARMFARLLDTKPCCSSSFGTFRHDWESQDMPVSDYSTKNTRRYLYGWGLVGNGELGVEEFLLAREHARPVSYRNKPYPIPISKNHPIKCFACGHGFTVFASGNDREPRLFGTGINSHGQLGYQHSDKNSSQFYQWLAKPRPIVLPMVKPKSSRITHVACGLSHTLVATTEGVFSLGNNCHGQGGRLVVENEDYRSRSSCSAHKIAHIDRPVQQLVCGLDHSLILLDNGQVMAFGLGTDGQLGDGAFSIRWEPKVVEGDLKGEKIIYIASSGDCCLAVSDKGDIFGWGNNEYKQLGSVTSGIQIGLPKRLPFKNVGKVVKVAAGGSVNLLLNESGQVYSWGYGFLGHGPKNVMKTEPTLLPPELFGCNQFDPSVQVTNIFAGLMNLCAINSHGDLYLWGKNDWASLGLGHDKEQYFPIRLDFGYKFLSVSLARFHTVAMARTFR